MKPIPVNEPILDGNEKKYLLECIDTNWISSEGPFVRRFEEKFAVRVGCRHGVAVSNGSAALDVAVAALEIGKGDEVILPTFTIISCATAVVRAGAVPVVVDSDPLTWNMDVAAIESKITSRTKAIMAVHIYGLPVDMDPLLALAGKYGLAVIEDAAQMHGQTYKDRPCGGLGTLGTFSFYPNKHITMGEGGIVVTNDDRLADRCRSLRNLCFQRERRFVHEELGWNFRLTNLQAAVGLAQLERLDESVERKRRMGRLYTEHLSGIEHLQLPTPATEYASNIYWVYGVLFKETASIDARTAMESLARNKIGTRPFFWPMHEQPVFRSLELFEQVSCPVAERLARRGFYLPSGLALQEDQIERVARALKDLF